MKNAVSNMWDVTVIQNIFIRANVRTVLFNLAVLGFYKLLQVDIFIVRVTSRI